MRDSGATYTAKTFTTVLYITQNKARMVEFGAVLLQSARKCVQHALFPTMMTQYVAAEPRSFILFKEPGKNKEFSSLPVSNSLQPVLQDGTKILLLYQIQHSLQVRQTGSIPAGIPAASFCRMPSYAYYKETPGSGKSQNLTSFFPHHF